MPKNTSMLLFRKPVECVGRELMVGVKELFHNSQTHLPLTTLSDPEEWPPRLRYSHTRKLSLNRASL